MQTPNNSGQVNSPSSGKIKGMMGTTPGKLRLGMFAIFILAICFAIAGYVGVSGARSSVNTIARDAVPSIVTAQSVRVKLLQMDSLAAQEFLAGGADSGAQARVKYEAVRQELGEQLTLAAKNISFGRDEQTPIETLMDKVQAYNGLVEAARANNRQGFPVGAAYLRMASTLLHNEMLPQTQAIDQLNVKQLESEYASFKSASVLHIGAIAASGLALLVVLGYMQLFISKKMRRSFNLPLLAASVVVVALTAYSIVGMTLQRSNLGAAKEASFVSAYNWLEARGAAYDAKTDQSLFLIALGAGAKYEESAKVKVEKLAAAAKTNVQGDSGSALSALRAYVQQDERIRSYDKSGKRSEAVNLALGNGTKEAQKAFDDLNQVLTANLKTATSSFEASIASAESNINLLDLAFVLLSLAVMGLAYFGLTPRINEYRA
ncbi:MAG: hypothetical protein WC028_31720 [Candidatus Obscuribacterales bacterium]